MLEKIDFDVEKITKEEYKPVRDELVNRLVVLQQEARSKGIGLVVLFEGWNGAGRGGRISDLMYNLDARATSVHVTQSEETANARMFRDRGYGATDFYPLMKEFWDALDMRGNMTLYDRGWYDIAAREAFYAYADKHPLKKGKRSDASKKELEEIKTVFANSIESAERFEHQLVEDGYVVVKFFLHITKAEQERRLKRLASDPNTAWRVEPGALKRINDHDFYYDVFDKLIERTNFDFAQWVVVNAEDRRRANLTIARTLVNALDEAVNRAADPEVAAAAAKAASNSAGASAQVEGDERVRTPEQNAAIREANEAAAALQHSFAPASSKFPIEAAYPTLKGVDYHLRLDREKYKVILKEEQKRLYDLELEMYLRRIPMIFMFEGQDAAGKGGSIKRIAQALDARSYTIYPSPAPTKPELMHPHLWRYWTRLPKAGHVGIYDRSWYGRVLVERVEGFASPSTWARAYDEINEFERDLVDWGAVLLKFWVEIDRDEQMKRFVAREQNPDKVWKITEEDWRNRDKYPQYREAVEDMFRLTSTEYAPWTILESNDKLYARVKVLKTINAALEKRLEQEKI